MLKVIALDIGGVCVNLHIEKALEAFGYASVAEIPAEFVSSIEMLEKGEISVDEWQNISLKITENKFSVQELRKIWAMIIGETVEGMLELAEELVDAGYKLVFFSNTSEIHMQEVYRKLSFSNLVTGCIFSYEVGAKKPDDLMYKAFEKEYGKPLFYVDDIAVNVEAGRRNAWNSHLFTSSANMRKALVNAKIL